MKDIQERPLLDPRSIKRVSNGNCKHWISMMQSMAERGKESDAGKISVKFSFATDEDSIEGEYVPEITISLKHIENV